LDRISGEIGALDGSLLLLYSSGGVIANRGMFSLRLADGTKIGELDEEFVWERRLGDHFHFGGRGWRITGIEAESVQAVPLETASDFPPFWKADTFFRSSGLSQRVLEVLDSFNAGEAAENSDASEALTAFLGTQRCAQKGLPLAGSGCITVEIIDNLESQGDFFDVVIHSFRGGAVNYPLTLALAQELEEKLKLRVESFSNDDAILFLVPRLGITDGGAAQIEEMRQGALLITRAILFVKQHSVNCIPAALYAMTRFNPGLFPPEEAERFIPGIFSDAKTPNAEDVEEIHNHILSLYRRFLAEGEKASDWKEPLLNFLKKPV
jgi:Lhr-like helicase